MNSTVRNILILLGVIGAIILPAYNITTEEIKDLYDNNPATAYQPEVVIDAWASVLKETVVACFLWFMRNNTTPPSPSTPPANPA